MSARNKIAEPDASDPSFAIVEKHVGQFSYATGDRRVCEYSLTPCRKWIRKVTKDGTDPQKVNHDQEYVDEFDGEFEGACEITTWKETQCFLWNSPHFAQELDDAGWLSYSMGFTHGDDIKWKRTKREIVIQHPVHDWKVVQNRGWVMSRTDKRFRRILAAANEHNFRFVPFHLTDCDGNYRNETSLFVLVEKEAAPIMALLGFERLIEVVERENHHVSK